MPRVERVEAAGQREREAAARTAELARALAYEREKSAYLERRVGAAHATRRAAVAEMAGACRELAAQDRALKEEAARKDNAVARMCRPVAADE